MTLPLADIRVLDLTQIMSGPFCTMLLADMGADVIKVETPGKGDQTRSSMGMKMRGPDGAGFLALNRNKRSITLDLKQQQGREVFYRLLEDADVVVENFRPGVTKRLGVDYDTLKALNPGVVYASISGFGQTGPYAQRAGYDLIAQGMAGVMSVTGAPGGTPVKCGIPVSDLAAGLYGAYSILSAYVGRGAANGAGQYIDVSLLESALALSVWETTELWATGRIPEPKGSAHRMSAPYQALRTKDGYLTLGANNDKLWQLTCEALGHPELFEDLRFERKEDRLANQSALEALLEEILSHDSTDFWVERLVEAGVPAGPIYNYEQVFEDPHVQARGMQQYVEHPTEGRMSVLGPPVKFSDSPPSVRLPAPLLGQHSDEILGQAGYSDDDVKKLRAESVL